MTTAIVFPGLAPSTYETVKDFVEENPYARRRFAEADEVLGFSLIDAFKDAQEEDWEINECAFLVNTVALADYAVDHFSLDPAYCVGSSFGATAGAVFTGSITFREALWLSYQSTVREKAYADKNLKGYQSDFIYRYPLEKARKLVKEYAQKGEWLEIASYLSDDLMAVCGKEHVIQEVKKRVRQEKGISLFTMNRLIHCSELKEIREQLGREVHSQVTFGPARIPMISDIDGSIFDQPHTIKTTLLDEYDRAIRLDLAIETMKQAGIEKVHIIGPRNIFGPLMRDAFDVQLISPETVQKAI